MKKFNLSLFVLRALAVLIGAAGVLFVAANILKAALKAAERFNLLNL